MSSETPRRPTIRDVAALAGVSKSSVSNYYHHPGKLSEAARERIAAAMAELQFSLNDAARTLRVGSSPVVGYVAFELASARTPLIANAVASALSRHDIDLLIATDQGDGSRESRYLQTFERQRVSGLLVSPLGDREDELARLRAAGIPSVLMTRHARMPEQPAVSIDHRTGGRLAAEHLMRIGRRRIGFVTDTLEVEQIGQRYDAARRVIESAGGSLRVVDVAERTVASGIEAGRALAADPGVDLDGLFCVNDLVAIGIAHGVGRAKRIPDDIAIVGYDDIEFAQTQAVPLTSVATPQAELGSVAAQILLEQMGIVPSSGVLQQEFTPTLVVRASTSTR